MKNRSALTDDELYADLGKAGAVVLIAILFVIGFLRGCAFR